MELLSQLRCEDGFEEVTMEMIKLLKRELDLKKYQTRLMVADVLMHIGRWANHQAEKVLDATKFDAKLWEE